MILAKTPTEKLQIYSKALNADPRISQLQILDMSRPLEVINVYVRLRVYREPRLHYELDPALINAETERDFDSLLKANQLKLESRVENALDPDEAIRNYKRCVIVGDPGAGKTTLLKYLTLKSANNRLDGLPNLPIYIELNAFVNSAYQDLLDYASNRWDDYYGFPASEARNLMDETLENGQAILLLDALDETVVGENTDEAETTYTQVANSIMSIATRYDQAPIVVTARKAGYQQRSSLAGFRELEVLDFRLEDIRLFINNWFEYSPDQQKHSFADDLNAKLTHSPRIQALAANPLLLSLIVLVYEAELDLPERRAELYKRCVDTLLIEWDAKRNIRRRREFKPEHKRQLLEEIVWHFHKQGRRYFPKDDLLKVIEAFLPAIGLPTSQKIRVLGPQVFF